MKDFTLKKCPTTIPVSIFLLVVTFFSCILLSVPTADATEKDKMYVVINDSSDVVTKYSFRQIVSDTETFEKLLLDVAGVNLALVEKNGVITYDNTAFFRKEIEARVVEVFKNFFKKQNIKIFYLKDFRSREELENAITDFMK